MIARLLTGQRFALLFRRQACVTPSNQNYTEDVFSDPRCTPEIRRHWLRDTTDIKRAGSVARTFERSARTSGSLAISIVTQALTFARCGMRTESSTRKWSV